MFWENNTLEYLQIHMWTAEQQSGIKESCDKLSRSSSKKVFEQWLLSWSSQYTVEEIDVSILQVKECTKG